MKTEIERKFLICEGTDWDEKVHATKEFFNIYESIMYCRGGVRMYGENIVQGYLPTKEGKKLARAMKLKCDFPPEEFRLRKRSQNHCFTIKGEGDIERPELETDISKETFGYNWYLTGGKRIWKNRLVIPYKGFNIDMDVYDNKSGRILAEVEFPSRKDADSYPLLGKEVTEDPKYKSINMVERR
ncbi:hypothetical protein ACFLZZ_00825 [Nanoarchaeota archaeon]